MLIEPEKCNQHEPDLKTLHIEYDGDTAYIDVNCKHCGDSGCIAKLPDNDEIQWEHD